MLNEFSFLFDKIFFVINLQTCIFLVICDVKIFIIDYILQKTVLIFICD